MDRTKRIRGESCEQDDVLNIAYEAAAGPTRCGNTEKPDEEDIEPIGRPSPVSACVSFKSESALQNAYGKLRRTSSEPFSISLPIEALVGAHEEMDMLWEKYNDAPGQPSGSPITDPVMNGTKLERPKGKLKSGGEDGKEVVRLCRLKSLGFPRSKFGKIFKALKRLCAIKLASSRNRRKA